MSGDMEQPSGSTVIPGMRYRDAMQAIEWLVRVLGFTRQAVFEGPHGTVAHAQLTLGKGMIMLGSATNEGELSPFMVQPDEIGGRETKSTYLIANTRAVYERAKGEGAEIVLDLREMSYGGWAFTCRDPEGHLWSVGDYDPWGAA